MVVVEVVVEEVTAADQEAHLDPHRFHQMP
jgi:hypothetical protein